MGYENRSPKVQNHHFSVPEMISPDYRYLSHSHPILFHGGISQGSIIIYDNQIFKYIGYMDRVKINLNMSKKVCIFAIRN